VLLSHHSLLFRLYHTAEAVSGRILTAVMRVHILVRSYTICGGQNGTEVGFPPNASPIPIPPNAQDSSSSSGAGSISHKVTKIPSIISFTPFQ
jgi:hypothetical protein